MDERQELREIIRRNMEYFMGRPECAYRNAHALASDLNGVTANSVRYLLKPDQRPKGKLTVDTLPRLDTLAAIAPRLRCEVWELLHPDIEALRKRLSSYAAFKKAVEETRQGAESLP